MHFVVSAKRSVIEPNLRVPFEFSPPSASIPLSEVFQSFDPRPVAMTSMSLTSPTTSNIALIRGHLLSAASLDAHQLR